MCVCLCVLSGGGGGVYIGQKEKKEEGQMYMVGGTGGGQNWHKTLCNQASLLFKPVETVRTD